MGERKHFGADSSADPDDAPELLPAFFKDAQIRDGEAVVRPYRGPGRPKTDHPKQQVTVRLDADCLSGCAAPAPAGKVG